MLIGPDHAPLAVGSHDWENQFVDRLWTYSIDAVWSGIQQCYAALAQDARQRYDVELTSVGSLGISAMMHGYLAFDSEGELLTPFRTWRNTNTGEAAEQLSELFGYNIPHRWSVAHLFQAILNGEDHVAVHRLPDHVGRLRALAADRGEGARRRRRQRDVPDRYRRGGYDAKMLAQFDQLAADNRSSSCGWPICCPRSDSAGEPAGELTEQGAKLLDPTGRLQPGIVMCAPEGDAGTGMVATNSVAPRTGNVSAGTSIFAMVVLEHELSRVHRELDLVTTPAGDLVAMVHCNNGASELNAWVGLFAEFAEALGVDADISTIFETLFTSALQGAPDGGGLMAYNYLSGEPITELRRRPPAVPALPGQRLQPGRLHAGAAVRGAGHPADRHGRAAEGRGRPAGPDVRARRPVQDQGGRAGLPCRRHRHSRLGRRPRRRRWRLGDCHAGRLHRRARAGQSLVDYLNSQVFADAPLETLTPDAADVAGFDSVHPALRRRPAGRTSGCRAQLSRPRSRSRAH